MHGVADDLSCFRKSFFFTKVLLNRFNNFILFLNAFGKTINQPDDAIETLMPYSACVASL